MAALMVAVALGSAGCTASDAAPRASGTPAASGGSEEIGGTLTVLAAASLTDVFTDLGERLEQEHPGLEVRFTFAGSSALATQLTEGAPADVFAAADEVQMAKVTDAGLAEAGEIFAENPLMLALPADNPGELRRPEGVAGAPDLADILDHDVTLAVCAPEVPCGAAAAEVLQAAGLTQLPDTYEDDVRAVLTKVQLGEVDAGLVYLSDVHAAGDSIIAFGFAESLQAINRYPITVLDDATNPRAAHAFVDLVLSPEGQRILRDAGFLEP